MVYLIVAVTLVGAFSWVPFVVWAVRKSKRLRAELEQELAASGERVVRGPERALYRGASARLPQVKGNCWLALTDKRLIVRRVVGAPFEVPVREFQSVREDKWFLSSYRSGVLNVIVKLKDGIELGWMAKDHAAWMNAVRGLLPGA